MRIKSKLITYLLAISLVPLLITMGLSLGYTSNVVEKLTLQAARERVDTSAEKLSAYFSSRIAEVQAYSQSEDQFPSILSSKYEIFLKY